MRILRFVILGLLFFSFGGCQKEEDTINQDTTQSFLKSSSIASLLSRTTQNTTSKDNVLDHTSCFSVQLPVSVTVNSQQIIVSDDDDYQTVQNAIDAYSNDDDIINFNFPITIKYKNYQTQVVNNSNDFDDVLENCFEDDGFNEIDCIALVYPIKINIYDSNNQIANSVTMTTNSNLFNFLANLNSGTYVSIKYPISAVNSNGQNIVLNSNSELESFLEDSIEDCDDNSGGGGTTLNQILVNGSWNIFYCYYEDENNTNYYNGYNFTFNNNGSISVQKNANFFEGDWDIQQQDGYLRLDLNFDGSSLEDIEKNWRIIEYTESIIKLKKQESSNTNYLTFKKN